MILGTYIDCEGEWENQRADTIISGYKVPEPNVKIAHLLRAFRISYKRRCSFTGVLTLADGQRIVAPKIHSVKTQSTRFGHCSLVEWLFENVQLQQDVIINDISIVDDFNFILWTKTFHLPLHGRAGEKLTRLSIGIVPEVSSYFRQPLT